MSADTDRDDELSTVELLAWLYDFHSESPVPKDFVWRIVKLMRHLNEDGLLDPLGGPRHPKLETHIRAAVAELNRLLELAHDGGLSVIFEIDMAAYDDCVLERLTIYRWEYTES